MGLSGLMTTSWAGCEIKRRWEAGEHSATFEAGERVIGPLGRSDSVETLDGGAQDERY